MKENLTIGGIWKNRRTGRLYELIASNGGSNRVQICPLQPAEGENGYNCMTPKSLRKNYTLEAIKKEDAVVENEPQTTEGTTEATGSAETKGVQRVELSDGRVITGTEFLLNVAGKTREETCKSTNITHWLVNSKGGKELLASLDAKIVRGKPLSK